MKKLSKDDIYNALCAVFFAEEVRLQERISDIQYRMWQRGADANVIIELIQAQARFDYFRLIVIFVRILLKMKMLLILFKKVK